jgi:prepilin-type N-terminal cleavage/methylation domain-containing protein/prepilin-type processing-associated H-X9-DG protein
MSKKVKNAFTLVELLVVISVIGLLMGILLPALSAAREQGRCVVCQSNLRNIGLALRMYLDDTHGKMPSADPYPGSYGWKSQHWFMNSQLMGYLGLEVLSDPNGGLIGPGKERSVLTCPTHRNPDMTKHIPPVWPAQERQYALSYMANATLGVSNKALASYDYRHESEYRKPNKAMMFCDGNGTMDTPGTVLYSDCPKLNFEYRHRGKVNTLFLDQHIESLEEKDIPFFPKWDEKRFGEFWYAKKRNR